MAVRRILHCDMDCFYAAVHLKDDPALKGKPVVVGGSPTGRGVIAAASYEARRFGIHSAMPASRAKRLCPRAIFVKPNFHRYRQESEEIFEIYRRFTPSVQTAGLDEAYLDVTEHLGTFGSATAIAKEIRRCVREERALTVSVGVAPNRLVAKIASDADKPDGLTVVRPGKVQAFLDPLPARRLPGVGPRTELVLQQMGTRTVRELRRTPIERLHERFGPRWGEHLLAIARGIDTSKVASRRGRRSLSTERTYSKDMTGAKRIAEEVTRLAGEVAKRLGRKNITARTVTLKVRYSDFTTLSRSATLPLPTSDRKVLARQAKELLRKTEAGRRPVRLLGVGTSNLVVGEPIQLLLFEEIA